VAFLIDNISLVNLGANNGNYTRDSGNRFEYNDIDSDSHDGWNSDRGRRGSGGGHGKGGKGGKGHCDD
jgi:hypothetical protein